MTKNFLNNEYLDSQTQLREWYASFLGQSMLAEIRAALAPMLYKTYGYHALQIGCLTDSFNFLTDSELIHPLMLNSPPCAEGNILAEAVNLPVRSKSLDLILLLHTLDISHDPYQTLREVDRALVNDGHVIILGFNPFSSWGGVRLLMKWRRTLPWRAHFYSMGRVQDWLNVLGFKILARNSRFFAPPINHPQILERLQFLRHAKYLMPFGGAFYLIKARKQTVPLIPLKQAWLPQRKLLPSGGLVRPTNRLS